MIERTCLHCGNVFKTIPSQIKAGGGLFCSRPCKDTHQKKDGISHHEFGYILIKKPEHARANKWGFVYEHIVVMENIIGRYLHEDEVVHHLNGNPKDNRPENLVVTTRSEHAKNHSKQRALARGYNPETHRRCHQCGEIKIISMFSPTTSRGRSTKNSKCKPCATSWQREYRKRTQEVI